MARAIFDDGGVQNFGGGDLDTARHLDVVKELFWVDRCAMPSREVMAKFQGFGSPCG